MINQFALALSKSNHKHKMAKVNFWMQGLLVHIGHCFGPNMPNFSNGSDQGAISIMKLMGTSCLKSNLINMLFKDTAKCRTLHSYLIRAVNLATWPILIVFIRKNYSSCVSNPE